MAKKLTSTKAKKILHDKTVHGKPLTDKQRRFFGAVASGAIPQAQNGIEGTMGGLTDIGFNYNGAWGGTMQDGGYIDSVLNANKNLDWVQRLYEKNTPSIKIPGQKGRSTHFMESADGRVYPTVVRMPNGKLKYLADKAYDYADSTKTYIQFPSDEAAQQFGKNYKKGTGVLKDFAMGGGLPGAVGFTYARTAGAAPANGPYAKKTKASAQSGMEMKYYQEGLDFRPKTISQDGSKTPKKKKTLILAEHDPEYWNNPDGSFSDRYINPFMTEAAGIKKYVNKYFPNEDVEIIPTYKQNIKEVLTKSDPNTRLVVMGHHGDKMFGIPSSEFVESIGNTKYENCYAGICYGDDLPGIGRPSSESMLTYLSRREDDQNKKITTRYPESYNLNNFNIRTDNLPWLGFAPVDRGGEEGFKDSFFRRTKNPEITKLQIQIRNIWDNSKEDYNVKSRKAAPIEAQLYKLYKKGEAVNMPKAVNTKELDYVPLPGRVYNYNDPLRFNPQQILQKKEQGGSIISPLGQWAYPGEVTTIPSNQITMQGVPYPVLGISDIGDVQMMYPGEDYTFDGEYVTEYPMAKGGISVNEADAQPIKKLDQLLNFTNYNDMAKAKKGKKLPKAQFGIPSEYNLNLAQYNPNTQIFNSPTGRISKFDTMNQGFTNSGVDTGVFNSLSSVNNALGDMGGIGGASSQLLGGIQLLMEEQRQKKKTKQFAALSEVAGKAATTRPVGIERKYVRPEDMLVEPGQIGSPYGTGMDFLQMEDGGFIGGNPTEIQNMYNPGDLYSDLGYEPLEDSTKVKQFKKGGKAQFGTVQAGQIGSTLGSFLGGGGGQQSGAGQIGSAVGGVAGNLLLPGVGGAIGSALGGVIGGAIGGQSQKKMEQMNRQAQGNLGVAALQQSLQGQFSGFMEHGGELKYLSHTWQPQTITKFGEYDVKDLLAPPKDADMLRAGGHLKEYTPPSEAAMSTERPAMQMGGELQTYWGGYAEPISYNPYLPDGGETVMFRGQSHDESDGKGRTGIGITYGNSPVEVERGEPAVKLRDGGTGDKSLVVFGNMQIPSYGASELNDPKAKGMKFKRYAEGLSKIETKANKTSEKAQSILENTDGSSPFDMLSMSTANAMMKGSDMKLKDAAMKKQLAAGIQSAILDTAEEMGVENDALAKGKIKAAKGGGKFTAAQAGINQPLTPILPVNTYYQIPVKQTDAFLQTSPAVQEAMKAQQKAGSKAKGKAAPAKQQVKRELMKLDFEPRDVSDMSAIPSGVLQKDLSLSTPAIEKLKTFKAQQPTEDKFNLLDLANQLAPYTRPLMRNPLDPGQLAPEMMALATNVVEPVQAQQFRPLLEETPTVSFQDQLNEIQAEANAARRLAGNNPAAQSAIAAQAAAAKNKVLAEQLRTNQALQLESRRRNLATLNDATLKNLAILDQQFTRQAQAKSATKAQAQLALSSIADKIARNRAETLQANVMSNMYPQYTFGPKGRIFNTGLTTFNIPTVASTTDSKTARNGSIVKAIKNL